MREAVKFLRRGRVVSLGAEHARMTLLDYLRLVERATGTKEGCNEGDCGACTVVLARLEGGRIVHRPVNSCILFAGQADGAEVITVEDIAEAGRLHPVQDAMARHHGSQCGFCTPGIVMSLFALYHEGMRPVARSAINDQLAGNLCRCTGYRPIVAAALEACAGPADDPFSRSAAFRASELLDLDDVRDVFVRDGERFFAAPATVEALADLYSDHPDATLVGGATDIGLWRTKKLLDLPKLIWLGRVKGLETITSDVDAVLIGASATHAQARAALAGIDPDLDEIIRRFGSEQVRASGTVGGNIANGSPIGDLAPVMIALGSTLVLRRGAVERRLALDDFFLDYGRQDRAPGEFVLRLEVPRLRNGERFRAFKLSKRFDEDISAVMMALRANIAGRNIRSARLAFGGMAATPRRAAATETALAGLSLDTPGTWTTAITALAGDFAPISDARASAAYRRETAGALLQKALLEFAGMPDRATRLIGYRRAEERSIHGA